MTSGAPPGSRTVRIRSRRSERRYDGIAGRDEPTAFVPAAQSVRASMAFLVRAASGFPLAATALLAGWAPARRATRISPVEALRAG